MGRDLSAVVLAKPPESQKIAGKKNAPERY